jgi:hypothetical protein
MESTKVTHVQLPSSGFALAAKLLWFLLYFACLIAISIGPHGHLNNKSYLFLNATSNVLDY